MRMIKTTLAFCLLVSSACSQNHDTGEFDRATMDSLFARIENNRQGMGSISIFKNGEEVYQHSFGYADVKISMPATADTKYRIGSISKTFTATMIMQLVEEGKLTLDTRLSDFFPDIPYAQEITIEQLLRHRSGLFNFTSSEDYLKWMETPVTQEDLMQKFVEHGTVFKPDEKTEYSNTNYVLLSFILEKIENKAYADILQERIIKPLKLENTYYGGKINPDNHEALSYTLLQDWALASETDMSIPVGAGALVSNPTDLNTFFTALFTDTIVSDHSLNEMKKLVEGAGIGMFQIPFYEKRAYGHNGGIDGFQSNAAYFPVEKVAIAYTANGVGMAMNDILIGALSIYFGKTYALPEFKPGLALTSEALDQYVGVYSSPTFPLKLTISKQGNVLIGQATGQPSFRLDTYETHKFKFDPAMLKIDFLPEENKLVLKQGGGEFVLTREE